MTDTDSAAGGPPEAQLPWRYELLDLRSARSKGWDKVREKLAGRRRAHQAGAPETIIGVLTTLAVKSAVLEFPYHDPDFSEEYAHHYTRLFRPGVKACARLHFFKEPVENLTHAFAWSADEKTRWSELRSLERQYLGFCVIRPTPDAPIGRTVLKSLLQPDQVPMAARTLSASHTVHLLSAEFRVEGFPFIEQDARTGACAQAALWMALRHLTAADRTPWLSVPVLTAAANSLADETSALSMPMGSGGLSVQGILRGVQLADRVPHYFGASPALSDGKYVQKWQDDDPFAMACRFIDSEIPVVLVLTKTPNLLDTDPIAEGGTQQDVIMEFRNAHAVTAIGYYGDNQAPAKREFTSLPHVSEWLSGLIVQNDQMGPNVELPRQAAETQAPASGRQRSEYVAEHITGLIVPLPKNVFLAPDQAEELAWMFVLDRAPVWWEKHIVPKYKRKELTRPKFFKQEQLAARTLLIDGHGHYAGLVAARAHPDLRRLSACVHYPRHVWITEFYERSLAGGAPDLNAIVAHVVSDATSAPPMPESTDFAAESFLFGHVLGMASATLTSTIGKGQLLTIDLPDDKPYRPWRPMLVHANRVRART